MRAILKEDRIIKIALSGGTEIDNIPADKRSVGLDRLRWTGDKIADIADLPEVWIRQVSGAFEFHAVEVDGSQKVTMTYATDRKNLVMENGVIRVKQANEIADEKKAILKQQERSKLNRLLGPTEDQVEDLYQLVYLLVDHAKTKHKDILDAIDKILDGDKVKKRKEDVKKYKDKMAEIDGT